MKVGLTMNEMNSETHSCTHSFASLLTFAWAGREVFIIRATLAIYHDALCQSGREEKEASL